MIVEYAAGFFDGEGSIILDRSRASYRLVLSIGQVDSRPLYFIKSHFGGVVKLTNSWRKRANAKPLYHWIIKDAAAGAFLLDVIPFLIVKQEQAKVALSFRATVLLSGGRRITPQIRADRERMAEQLTALRSHPAPFSQAVADETELLEMLKHEVERMPQTVAELNQLIS